MKVGLGIGMLVCILVPVALLLFGIVDVAQAAALLLLLAGLWTVIFGALLARSKDRLYDIGFGIIVATLASFIYLPLQYAGGLVVVAIIVIVVASIVARPKVTRKSMP